METQYIKIVIMSDLFQQCRYNNPAIIIMGLYTSW